MKKVQTCKTQEEILSEILFVLDLDKYKMLSLKFINSDNNQFTEIDKLVNYSGIDEVYKKWHDIKNILPLINDSTLLTNFKEQLRFYKKEINYKNENRRVVYNSDLFLEYDEYHIEKYKISIYDRVKSFFDRIIILIDFIINEIEMRINEIGTTTIFQNHKSLNLKFAKGQTKVVALFLILENYGIFHQPEEQKPLNKIFDGAQFPVGGDLKAPADLPSVISKIRNGQKVPRFKGLNKKTKKVLKEAAQELIDCLDRDGINIFYK